MASVHIRRADPDDVELVLASSELFDHVPQRDWTTSFLVADGHHLLFALDDDERAVGFVSGVETTHPDKGSEMFLYELGVVESHRRQGIGRALVAALADLARKRGCYGAWVVTAPDNEAALATYRSAGYAAEPTVTLSRPFD